MASVTKLQFSGESGLTVKAVLRDLSSDVWNGEEIVTFDGDNYDDYGVALTEQGTSGHYVADVPEDLPVGKYHVTYQHQVGAVLVQPGDGDDVIFQAFIQWDGSTLVDDLVVGSSVVSIWNMALSHLGIGNSIASQSEDSEEADACSAFWASARDMALRGFTWPFATRIAALALVEEDPNDEWGFAYRYPANAQKLIRILSGARTDSRQSEVKYIVRGDDSGQLIYTDKEDAELEYVTQATNPVRYPPDFTLALSYLLAYFIAPRLTKGDAYKLRDSVLKSYAMLIQEAKANAGNDARPDEPPESEFISGRN